MQAANHSKAPSEGWTRRKLILLALSVSPFIFLVVVLAWGQLRTGGNPGGLLVHTQSGEVPVTVHPAPAFSGINVQNGNTVDNASLKGKVVVLDFWSSWCTSCQLEAADFASVYRQYANKPVVFVGMAIWDQTGDVLRFLNNYNVTYPVIIDAKGTTAVDYGVRGVPEKYFIDQNGNVVRKITGPIDPTKLSQIIDSMLAS